MKTENAADIKPAMVQTRNRIQMVERQTICTISEHSFAIRFTLNA